MVSCADVVVLLTNLEARYLLAIITIVCTASITLVFLILNYLKFRARSKETKETIDYLSDRRKRNKKTRKRGLVNESSMDAQHRE